MTFALAIWFLCTAHCLMMMNICVKSYWILTTNEGVMNQKTILSHLTLTLDLATQYLLTYTDSQWWTFVSSYIKFLQLMKELLTESCFVTFDLGLWPWPWTWPLCPSSPHIALWRWKFVSSYIEFLWFMGLIRFFYHIWPCRMTLTLDLAIKLLLIAHRFIMVIIFVKLY